MVTRDNDTTPLKTALRILAVVVFAGVLLVLAASHSRSQEAAECFPIEGIVSQLEATGTFTSKAISTQMEFASLTAAVKELFPGDNLDKILEVATGAVLYTHPSVTFIIWTGSSPCIAGLSRLPSDTFLPAFLKSIQDKGI